MRRQIRFFCCGKQVDLYTFYPHLQKPLFSGAYESYPHYPQGYTHLTREISVDFSVYNSLNII